MEVKELCIAGVVVLLILLLVFFAFDAGMGSRAEPELVDVTNREYRPPYTTREPVLDKHGNPKLDAWGRPVMDETYHPARYIVSVLGSDGSDRYDVNGADYALFVVGKKCTRWRNIGRWTGWRYNRHITPILISLDKTE